MIFNYTGSPKVKISYKRMGGGATFLTQTVNIVQAYTCKKPQAHVAAPQITFFINALLLVHRPNSL